MNPFSFRDIARLVIPSGFLILGLFLFSFFSEHSSSTVWNGYRILAVPLGIEETQVLSILEDHGITEYCTESNSLIINTNTKVPVIPFLDALNSSISTWFRFASDNVRLLYLAEIPFLDGKIKKISEKHGIVSFFEHSSTVIWIPFALSVAYWLLLLRYSGKKKSFFASSFPFCIIALSLNNTAGSVLSIGLLTAAYLVSTGLHTDSRQFFRTAVRLNILPVILPASLLLAVLLVYTGLPGIIQCIAAVCCSVFLVFFGQFIASSRAVLRNRNRLHPGFSPVAINVIPKRFEWRIPFAAISAGTLALSIVSSFLVFGSPGSGASVPGSEQLSFPSPSGYTVQTDFSAECYESFLALRGYSEIPDLADFLLAHWILESVFWSRVQHPVIYPKPGETITYSMFSAHDEGRITEAPKTVCTFDTAFIRKAFSESQSKLEMMLVKQQRFVGVEIKRLKQ